MVDRLKYVNLEVQLIYRRKYVEITLVSERSKNKIEYVTYSTRNFGFELVSNQIEMKLSKLVFRGRSEFSDLKR